MSEIKVTCTDCFGHRMDCYSCMGSGEIYRDEMEVLMDEFHFYTQKGDTWRASLASELAKKKYNIDLK